MKRVFLYIIFPCYFFTSSLFVFADTQEILHDVNVYRATHNLSPLISNTTLCTLASTRVKQIQEDWSHLGFQTEIDRITGMNGVFYENLARRVQPNDVVTAWSMSLVGHNEAMLIPQMKFGCVVQLGEYYTFEGYVPR